MSELTKKQRMQLEQIKNNLERGINYLMRPEIIGIAEKINSPLGCDYTVRNLKAIETCHGLSEHIRAMDKQAGSDIAGLYQALSQLDNFLNPPPSLQDTLNEMEFNND